MLVGRWHLSIHLVLFLVDKERLIMLVMVGASRSVHCLSRRVGMGSSAHVLEGADAIRSETVLIGTLSNELTSQSLYGCCLPILENERNH